MGANRGKNKAGAHKRSNLGYEARRNLLKSGRRNIFD